MLHRSFGKICFATISDGTGRIQILFARENCQINVDGKLRNDIAPNPPDRGEDSSASVTNQGGLFSETGEIPPPTPPHRGATEPETITAYKFAEKLIDLGDFI
jgi:hypothetical protein